MLVFVILMNDERAILKKTDSEKFKDLCYILLIVVIVFIIFCVTYYIYIFYILRTIYNFNF